MKANTTANEIEGKRVDVWNNHDVKNTGIPQIDTTSKTYSLRNRNTEEETRENYLIRFRYVYALFSNKKEREFRHRHRSISMNV